MAMSKKFDMNVKWCAENIKRGLRVCIGKSAVATVMQASWNSNDEIDQWCLVCASKNTIMPESKTREEMASYLNEYGYFDT